MSPSTSGLITTARFLDDEAHLSITEDKSDCQTGEDMTILYRNYRLFIRPVACTQRIKFLENVNNRVWGSICNFLPSFKLDSAPIALEFINSKIEDESKLFKNVALSRLIHSI